MYMRTTGSSQKNAMRPTVPLSGLAVDGPVRFSLDMLHGPMTQFPLPYGSATKGSTDFKILRKIIESAYRTRHFQDDLTNQLVELMAANLSLYAYSVSFPEVATFVVRLLKQYMTKMGETAAASNVSQLLKSIEQNIVYIQKLRDKGDLAPRDITNGVSTYFSPSLKNSEKAPVVLFYAKFMKQVEQWEQILQEKRVKVGKFVTYDSDEEKADEESGGEEETEPAQDGKQKDSKKQRKENGKQQANGKKEKENTKENDKKPKQEKKRERKPKEDKKKKKGEVPASVDDVVGKFGSDLIGDLVMSDDEGETNKERPPKQANNDTKNKQNGVKEKQKQPNSESKNKQNGGKKEKRKTDKKPANGGPKAKKPKIQ